MYIGAVKSPYVYFYDSIVVADKSVSVVIKMCIRDSRGRMWCLPRHLYLEEQHFAQLREIAAIREIDRGYSQKEAVGFQKRR